MSETPDGEPYTQKGGWAMEDNDAPWIVICDSEEQAERVLADHRAMAQGRRGTTSDRAKPPEGWNDAVAVWLRADDHGAAWAYADDQRAIGLGTVYDHIGSPDPDKPGQSTEVAIIQWIERTMAEWKREQIAAIELRAQLATAKAEGAREERIRIAASARDWAATRWLEPEGQAAIALRVFADRITKEDETP